MSDSSTERLINFNDGGPGDFLCDSCSDVNMDKRAVKTCQTCSSSYCEKHIRKHYTEARFQTHQLVDVPGGLEPCQDHHKPLEVFCLTDQMFICSQCSVTKHKGHDIHHQTQQAGGKRSAGVGAQRPRLVQVLPPPGEISFLSVKPDSVTLSWGPPEGLEGSRKFRVTWEGDGEHKNLTVTDMYRVEITGLQPGQKYDFSVATQGDHGNHSNLVSASTYTVVPPPRNIKVDRLGPSSFKVHWSRSPGMDHVPQRFLVSYTSPGEEPVAIHTEDCCTTLTDLQPGTLYTVGVCTVLNNGQQSDPVNTTICTSVPAPDKLTVISVEATSATVSWEQPDGMDQTQLQYQVSYQSAGTDQHITTTTSSLSITLSDLRPASEYSVSVCSLLDNRKKSPPVLHTFTTRVPPPADLITEQVQPSSLTLRWTKAGGMETIPHHFLITYSSPGSESKTTQTADCCTTLTDLLAGTHYTVGVSTVLDHGGEQSEPASTTIVTVYVLNSTLESLGLRCFFDNKLTVGKVREIGEDAGSDQTATDLQSQVLLFLQRLMMMNMKARSLTWHTNQDSGSDAIWSSEDEELPDEDINPLDLITALFLCSDGIFQQELSLKLSLCQFAVPLLLPNPETQQSTLMLWAMRDIVKQFRPHTPGDSKEYVEKSIVDCEVPMISFVRLGRSSLSKSKFLNEVLSNSHQINTFVHHNMAGGNTPRQISDGLVETSWYLPSGDPDSDVFSEPVAVANLRGDLQKYQTQFAFLSHISSAAFVFCDDLSFDTSIVSLQSTQKLFVVCDCQSENQNDASLKKLNAELKKNNGGVIMKGRNMNDADLVRKLRSAVKDVLKSKPLTVEGKRMADVACNLGILVDEECDRCKSAKSKAEKITKNVLDIHKYMDKQLPLQRDTWKELTKLEKDECKPKKVGDEYIEMYRQQKNELRKKQVDIGMSESIKDFIAGLKTSEEERFYFLKWMKINLDNLSRTRLSELMTMYLRNVSQNCPEDDRANLRKYILNSYMGIEHFFREVGQLYEAAMLSAETSDLKQEVQELPRICAELMLAGSPLELMDGDTSNIPMKWITDVLKELDSLTEHKKKIRVVTVLGCQSSGKSTLLNTMFGVQFAVSSGRCTRGAFMQLIKVKDEFRDEIQCDFIMIIDTEGLKAVQLSQITDNYEHDNELATLVVGLSDISIVNIAVENGSDVRDLLQIVAHAFLRMRESGKMPSCQFVHQNVTDISAHDKNCMDNNILLEQLNEMTRVASRMEKIDECDFTDIIIYKPEENCNIPGLWHGSPPMAPVNEGYSAAVAKLKQQLINTLENQSVAAQTFPEFCEWLECLWTAIKKENFIFSFRNSLVAQAYNKLCAEFNRWEGTFERHMYNWLMNAKTRVANYGLNTSEEISGLKTVLQQLTSDANIELDKKREVFQNEVTIYYENKQGTAHLVEEYRQFFTNMVENQAKGMNSTVKRQLEVAVDVRSSTFTVDSIKRSNRETLDKKVSELVKKIDRGDQSMTDQEIEQEFKKMWDKTIGELSFGGLEVQKVAKDIYIDLNTNLGKAVSNIITMVNKAKPIEEQGKGEFEVKKYGRFVLNSIKKKMSKEVNESEKVKTETKQKFANEIIVKCKTLIDNKLKQGLDYHCTHTREILELIEENLEKHTELHISAEIAAALKIHICGHAAREFQRMHDAFIRENDPRQNLEKLKPQYLKDFKDLYHSKDLCNRKAEEFTDQCVKQSVREHIKKGIGKRIFDEMQTDNFRSRRYFQFSMMKNLISSDFATFLRCMDYYDGYSYEFMLNVIVSHFSNGNVSLADIQVKRLKEICYKIQYGVSKISQKLVSDGKALSVTQFIQELVTELSEELVIHNETTGMNLDISKTQEFSKMLTECITNMEHCLIEEFHSDQDVLATLGSLPDFPQDMLHSSLLGCGKQCPYCKAPCNVEGKTHSKHSAFIHRPVGFGGIFMNLSGKRLTQNCLHFQKQKIMWLPEFVQYRKMRKVWDLQPINSTISDYWKFLLVRHNEEYAEIHSALPADIPEDWKEITSEQALKSLTEEYYPDTKDQ